MERRTLYIVIAIASLSLKLCALAAKSSRPSYSYPSYSSSYNNSYNALGSPKHGSYDSQLRELQKELDKELERAVQRHCASVATLHAEVDFTDPSMASLNRDAARALLPSGTWLPKPLSVDGLAVTLQDNREGEHRACLDADEALLKKTLATERPSSAPVRLGEGAWVVETTDDTATVALLSRAVRDELKVKGALVAFAPTDNVVTFADGANAASVALAAKEAAKRTDTSGDQGCVAAEPLALSSGTWATWLPGAKHAAAASVERYRSAARECQVNLAKDTLDSLSSLSGAGLPGAPSVPQFDATEREFSLEKGATVTVLLDDSVVPQLVAPASTVIVDSLDGTRYSMDWGTFEQRAAAHMKPVVVKGSTLTNSMLFEGGLSVKDFAGKKGVIVAKATP